MIKKFEIIKEGVVLKCNSLAGSFDNLTLSEIRLFCIYLAKINPLQPEKHEVTFSLDEYCHILGITDVKKERLQYSADRLLTQLITLKIDEANEKGISRVQMFSRLKIYLDETQCKWVVSLKAHEDIIPFLFNQQKNFFQYKLWNVLNLSSSNQIILYEMLKSKTNGFFKNIRDKLLLPKSITISLEEIKINWFGFKDNEYPNFKIFNRDVLKVCQNAINTYTDIKFDYTLNRGVGKGRPVKSITFYVERNKNYNDVFQIEKFMQDLNISIHNDYILETNESTYKDKEEMFTDKNLGYLAGAVSFEFSETEMRVLFDLILRICPYEHTPNERYNLLRQKYNIMLMQDSKEKINHRFNYIKALIETDL